MLISVPEFRRLCRVVHRDLGYFCAGLVIVYSMSGIALNHVDDWNPDFVIHKESFALPNGMGADLSSKEVQSLTVLVGQARPRVVDSPTQGVVKIYYEDATLHVDTSEARVFYERVVRRPFFYEANVLHRNSIRGWRWAADAFALVLIAVTVSGLFILKGRHGLSRRGVWWIGAGTLPPVVMLLLWA